jgi:hypothetical protein
MSKNIKEKPSADQDQKEKERFHGTFSFIKRLGSSNPRAQSNKWTITTQANMIQINTTGNNGTRF